MAALRGGPAAADANMAPVMSTEPPSAPTPPSNHGGGGGWLRPVAVVLACLVLGFVGGWILRGDDGTVTVLESGAPARTASDGPSTTPAGTGTTGTAPSTTTAPPPPTRAEIVLVVLNGTDVAGLAGETATRAESLGYPDVVAGNAPTSTTPSTVYHAPGQQAAARRVARDLQIDEIAPMPTSGPIATAVSDANPDTHVAVVLGP